MVRKKSIIDVTEHVLVPQHELCTEAEKKKLMEKYHTTDQQLPKIPQQDPAIQHLDVKEGDVIRITRQSATAGTTIFYRIVSIE